ncbi:MAG TPA: DUF2911 domain-containing protein, partial [Gemmatimonadaceae bacterium]|nr:DUF2911 domain-containing protein [Gemmatimonadaceae bacterium]
MFTTLVSLIAVMAGAAPASPVPDTASLVTTLGRDTIAVESYQRTPARLQGDIVLRAPRTVLYHYVIDFRADGGLARSVLDFSAPGMSNGPRIRTTITVTGDTARIEVDSSDVRHTFTRAVSPSVMPALMTGFGSDYGLYISFGMYQAIAATLGPGLDTEHDVPVIDAATGDLRTKHLVRRSATDVDVDYFRIAWTHLAIDASGRIESADASETTEKTHSARTGPANIASTVTAFEQRDRAGESVGVLSPARVATGQIGSASVIIQYSSPRKRGRVILGATVPFDHVWRTGANAATQLVVDHPLTIGRATIPAGMYTIWTIPGPNSATLIINGQHGQWG